MATIVNICSSVIVGSLLVGSDGYAAESPSLATDKQWTEYVKSTEKTVCEPMELFVGFYLAFRLSGEEEIQSKERYQQVRDSHSPYNMAIDNLGMTEQQAQYYSKLSEHGAALADKFLDVSRQEIESKVAELMKALPADRREPESKNSETLEPPANVEGEKKKMQNLYVRAARIMCSSLVRSSVADELKRKTSDR